MAEVKVLLPGYTSEESGEETTQCTVSLVKDEGIVMVVDPGTLKDRQMLIDALQNEGLSIDDVTHVCITHSHMDHYRNIGMFPNAIAVDYWGVWEKDTVDDLKENFSNNITIIKTPGHNYDAITLLIKTGEIITAIVGDVFWKENKPVEDPYASDKSKLEESRKIVLEKANFIIPGHGNIYKVNM